MSRPHPALDRPLIAAVVKLARKHRPEDLAELGMRLDKLGFVGRPGFFASKEGPNICEESAIRWLALSQQERNQYFEGNHDLLPATWIADWLIELLPKALRTGEVCLVEGPDAVMDAIEFTDGRVLRAMRVDFAQAPSDRTSTSRGRPPEVPAGAEEIAKPAPPVLREDVDERFKERMRAWREEKGRAPTRPEDYAWGAKQKPKIIQRRIDELRRKHRTAEEQIGGAPIKKPAQRTC